MTNEQYKNGQRDARIKALEDDIAELKKDRFWLRSTIVGVFVTGGFLAIERFLQ